MKHNRSRIALLLVLTIHTGLWVRAQKVYQLMDWKPETTLNTWLVQQVHAQYDVRRGELEKALQSRGAAEAYVRRVRQKFASLIGPLPARTPLEPQITGLLAEQGYHIEKILYSSFPGHHVTANLYLPEGKGPFPAALLFCGHEDVSKATDSYQRTAILLARNGFVVLVIDPISQGERYQITSNSGTALTRGGTTEHTLLNAADNLLGGSVAADELWDNIRGLDYLVTRKEVDTARIGCLGNSGGAMQTLYFAAFDSRIKVLAPCSYLSSRERTLELSGPADGCAQIPGEGSAHLELSDYVMAAAPRPVLVLAGRFDFIDYRGATEAFAEIRKIYTALGHPERARFFAYDDGHGISQPKREEAVRFFCKWLKGVDRPITEGALSVHSDKDLFVTPAGSVALSDPEELSVVARNWQLAKDGEEHRRQFLRGDTGHIHETIRYLLGMDNKFHPLTAQQVRSISRNGVDFTGFILRQEGDVPLPLLVAMPEHPTGILVWLHEDGKGRMADSAAWVRACLAQGWALVLPDLRGLGEMEDRPEFNDPKYFNREYRNAMLSLHIGKCLVGQRTADVLRVIDFIKTRREWTGLPIQLQAAGLTAVPALHAVVLDRRVERLRILGGLPSWTDFLNDPARKDQYSGVVPGALRYYDLPDLKGLAGDRVQIEDVPAPPGKNP